MRYIVFEEADGWHISDRDLDYLDARGKAYPTKTAARRAAQQREAELSRAEKAGKKLVALTLTSTERRALAILLHKIDGLCVGAEATAELKQWISWLNPGD